MHPPMMSPRRSNSNAGRANIPTSIPMWYIAKSEELNRYATLREVYFFKVMKHAAAAGCEYYLVEQDNAAKMPDAFSEMQKSFAHLRPIIF